MPLDFPSSPTNGQVYGNYYYNSARGAWNALLPAATPNFFTNATLNTSTLVDATATASAISVTPLIVKSLSGQTTNIQSWQDSSTTLAGITQFGGFYTSNRLTVGASSISTSAIAHINTINAGNIGLLVRGSASQTANLQEWQNSGGTVLSSVSSSGLITTPSLTVNSSASINSGAAGTTPLIVKAAASQTADIQQWQSSTGAVLSDINSAGELQVPRIGVGSVMPTTTMFQSTASAVGNIPIVARGIASQTANLQEWQDSAATVRASISPAGALTLATPLAIASGGTGTTLGSGLVPLLPSSLTAVGGTAVAGAGGTITITGCTAVGINTIFTSAFRSYKIIFTWGTTSTADDNMFLSLRNGTTNSTVSHAYAANLSTNASGNSVSISNNVSFWHIGITSSTGTIARYATFSGDITGPMDSTAYTSMTGQAISANGVGTWETRNIGAHHDIQAAYDGLYIWTQNARTFSGNVQIFGYRG